VVLMLDGMGRFGGNGSAGAGATYQKDGTYQPNGAFSSQVPLLAAALTSSGFDADDLGIY
jgi:hypothetical protein